MDFEIQLKSPVRDKETGLISDEEKKEGLALLVAYSKEFKSCRFVYSTGVKLPRPTPDKKIKLSKQLKDLRDNKAEEAYESLKDRTVN